MNPSQMFGKALLLASGGLDSTTLAYWMQDKGISFIPLFINYGQHSFRTELSSLRSALPPEHQASLVTLDVSPIYCDSRSRLILEADLWNEVVNDDDLYLPQRNLLLLSIGAAFAQARGSNAVYAGFIESHRAPGADCCDAFFGMLDALMLHTSGVQFHFPFRTMAKSDVAQTAIHLGVPIGLTYSCLAAAEIPCGACPNCVDRLQAIRSLG